MQRPPPALDVDRISLVVTPDFASLALTMLTNVLRLANREAGQETFVWQLLSPRGGDVCSSDGITVSTRAVRDCADPGAFVMVVASYHPLAQVDAGFRAWLRRQQREGRYLVGIESGATVFAAAGILGDHAVAQHYEDILSFRESWPEQPLFNGLFNMDRQLATVAGVTATFDFALAFVESRRGAMMADQIARVCLHERRDALGRRARQMGEDDVPVPVLQRCRQMMLDHLQAPLSLDEICLRLGIQQRRLRRLFQRALGVSPMRYYQALRLTEARFMLVNTDLPTTEVALACGFESASTFARAFKGHFGFSPSQRREPYMGLFPSPFWPRT